VRRRAVVTGAAGPLGRHVARRLERGGWEVTALGRADLDVLDAAACRARVSRHAPAVVVDCSLPAVEEDAVARGAGNVACAAAHVGARSIYISCAMVFDGEALGPYVESDAPSPASPLAVAKVAAERAVTLANDQHTIVRTGWLVDHLGGGRAQAPTAGDDVRGTPTPPAHLADALYRLATHPATGIFHVSCAGSCTASELTGLLAERPWRRRHLALVPQPGTSDATRNLVLATRRANLPPLPVWTAALAAELGGVARVLTT
jgi:dTDP-4-dehydrorhamnose reductase